MPIAQGLNKLSTRENVSNFALAPPGDSSAQPPAPLTNAGPQPSAKHLDVAIKDAWEAHKAKLKEHELTQFEGHAEGELSVYLSKIQELFKKQKLQSKTFTALGWVKPLFETLDVYMPAAILASSAVSQVHPNPSSSILGGIMCVMQLSTNISKLQEAAVQNLSYMARKIVLVQKISKQVFDEDKELQLTLTNLYGDVLDLCRSAYRLLIDSKGNARGGLKTLGVSLVMTSEARYGDIIRSFDENYEEFQEHIKIYDRSQVQTFHETQNLQGVHRQQALHRIAVAVEKTMEDLAFDRHDRQLDRRQRQLKKSGKKKWIVKAWIKSTPYLARYDFIWGELVEGTGQWLIEHPDYEEWKTTEDSALLWLTGKPGSGKSFLAAIAINDLKWNKDNDIALAYFFCKDEKGSREVDHLLGSILQQLLHQAPGLHRGTEDLYDSEAGSTKDGPTWHGMLAALFSIISCFATVFIVADGLDECEDKARIAKLLWSLIKISNGTVKILTLSQPMHPDLDDVLMGAKSIIPIDSGGNEADIKLYIDTCLAEDRLSIGGEKRLFQEAKDKLQENADGMFLYIFFMVKSLLEKRSPADIEQMLENLPRGLGSVYETRIMQLSEVLSEEDRELVFKIILFTHFSARPLTEEEMLEALAISIDTQHLEKRRVFTSARGLVALCANLVSINAESQFVLCHTSFGEYLRTFDHKLLPVALRKQMETGDVLANVCMSYLLLDNFDSGPTSSMEDFEARNDQYKFLQYAATQWGYHVNNAKMAMVQDQVQKLISSPSSRNISLQYLLSEFGRDAIPFVGDSSPLHLLAVFGLAKFTGLIQDVYSLIDALDGSGRTPCDYACEGSEPAMVLWLLNMNKEHDITDEDIANNISIMRTASERGWSKVVKCLIDLSYDIEDPNPNTGFTPLMLSAEGGYLDVLQDLLNAGADVHAVNGDGETAFSLAVKQNHHELWNPLLAKGSDIDLRNGYGSAPLHYACRNRDVEAVRFLIGRGCTVSVTQPLIGNLTAMHIAAGLDCEEIVQLLHWQAISVCVEDDSARTPLHFAAFRGAMKAVRKLIELGAKHMARDLQEWVPLHCAASGGHTDLVDYFLNADPDEVAIDILGEIGQTPLHHAAGNGRLDTVEYLLKNGAQVNIATTNEHHQSPLHLALADRHIAVARVLIQHGADVNAAGFLNRSPLHYAADYGLTSLLDELLSRTADVDATDKNGTTALQLCSARGYEDFAIAFCNACPALTTDIPNIFGWTPLHCAAVHGLKDLTQLLIDRHSKVTPTNKGSMPMHFASALGRDQILRIFVNQSNVNVPGGYGCTMLFSAAISGHTDALEVLLENGADPDRPDNTGNLPLVGALFRNNIDVANRLIENGANCNLSDGLGATPLHAATMIGDSSMVRKLLEKQCNGLAKDIDGITPFVRAVEEGHTEIVKLFLEFSYDGFNDSDSIGVTTFHRAASAGNIEIINMLLEKFPNYLTVLDDLKESVIHKAARNGHSRIIKILLKKGAPSSNLSRENDSALFFAADNGFPTSVKALLKADDDGVIDTPSLPFGATPLIAAARRQSKQCLKLLLEAGANPYISDVFGLNAFDYASRHEPTLQTLMRFNKQVPRLDKSAQKNALKHSILKSLRHLLTTEQLSPAISRYSSISHLQIVVEAAIYLEEAFCSKDLNCLFVDLVHDVTGDYFSYNYSCDLCERLNFASNPHICSTCVSAWICDPCFERFCISGKQRIPDAVTKIRELEAELRSLVDVTHAYEPDYLFILALGMGRFSRVVSWTKMMQARYRNWHEEYNSDSHWSSIKRPGEDLLKIFSDTYSFCEKPGEGQSDKDQSLLDRFAEWRRNHSSSKESAAFICAEHKFIEIDRRSCERLQQDHQIFGEDGRLTQDWLRQRLQHYEAAFGITNQNEEFERAIMADTTGKKGLSVTIEESGSFGREQALLSGPGTAKKEFTATDSGYLPELEGTSEESSAVARPKVLQRSDIEIFVESYDDPRQLRKKLAVLSWEFDELVNDGSEDSIPDLPSFEDESSDDAYSEYPRPENSTFESLGSEVSSSELKRYRVEISFDGGDFMQFMVVLGIRLADAIFPGFARDYFIHQRRINMEQSLIRAHQDLLNEKITRKEYERQNPPLHMGYSLLFGGAF